MHMIIELCGGELPGASSPAGVGLSYFTRERGKHTVKSKGWLSAPLCCAVCKSSTLKLTKMIASTLRSSSHAFLHQSAWPPMRCLLYTSDAADERSSVD